MLASVFGKSIKDSWKGVLGWGLSLGLFGFFLISAFTSLPPEALATATQLITNLPPGLKGFIGDIEITSTVGGLLNWRFFLVFPFFMAVFTIQKSTAAVAGEEERNTLDVILSCPIPRWRLVLEKFAAVTVSTLAVAFLIILGFWAGIAVFAADVEYHRVPLAVFNGVLVGLAAGAFALFVTGLMPGRRSAGLITGVLLVSSYLLNTLAVVAPALGPYRPLSIFYHYGRSQPLIGGMSWENAAIMAGAAFILLIGAVAGFQWRDLGAGSPFARLASRLARGAPGGRRPVAPPRFSLLYTVGGKALRDAQWAVIAWGGSLGLLAVLILAFYPLVQQFPDLDRFVAGLPPAVQALFGNLARLSSLTGFLNTGLLSYLPVVLSVFAITESTEALAGEEERRSADVLLSLPLPRWRLLVEKIAAIVVGLFAVAALTFGGLAVGAALVGVGLEWWRLLGAAVNAVPPAMVMGALALLVSSVSRGRALAVGVATGVTAISYFLNTLAPLVTWLEPLQPLSVFYHYSKSQPLAGGLAWSSMGILTGAAIVFFAGSVAAFEHRDIGG